MCVGTHMRVGSSRAEPLRLRGRYLVKWAGSPYAECSWELLGEVVSEADVEAYSLQSNRTAAESAEEQRKREMAWLQIGSSVEVMPGEGVYAGSWCDARTVNAVNDGMLLVEFSSLRVNEDDLNSARLRQRVPLSRVRPIPGGGGGGDKGGEKSGKAGGKAGGGSEPKRGGARRSLICLIII